MKIKELKTSVNAFVSGVLKVLGDNGIEGYCYKKDLYDLDNQPKSIEEAVKMQEERDAAGNSRRVLNVYESDGKTIIDTFTTG